MFRRWLRGCLAFLIAGLGGAGVSGAGEPGRVFTPGEEAEIREIVRGYLLENPDAVVEIMRKAQDHVRVQAAAAQREKIADHMTELGSPGLAAFVAGNPAGTLTVIEFFDYQCSACRATFPELMEAVREDGDIRLILREMPVFGPVSTLAAQAAAAAARQGKYLQLHSGLMTTPGRLDEARILAIAGQLGLDAARLRNDMQSSALADALARNRDLARSLGSKGTPAFILGGELLNRGADRSGFLSLFRETRARLAHRGR